MKSCAVQRVYAGKSNSIDMELTLNGADIDYSTITRITMELDDDDGTVIDSQVDVTVFDWLSNDYLSIRLGLRTPALEDGTYKGFITVYDAANPSGIQWDRPLLFNIQ